MDAEKLRHELVQLLERKGVHPELIDVPATDYSRILTQSVYVTRRELEEYVGPSLDFLIDGTGLGLAIAICDIPGHRFGLNETQAGRWTLEDVERQLPAWLERLAELRGEDCPDCQGAPSGEVQQAKQRGCATCRGIGRVNQAEPRIES